MAALVQTFPQQSSTVSMLHTRPSSSSGPFPNGGQIQPSSRLSQMPRTVYNGSSGSMSGVTYRGQPTMSPVAPYAFTSTPGLTSGGNPLRQNPPIPHLRQENRTSSAPVVPLTQQNPSTSSSNLNRQRQSTASPIVTIPSASLHAIEKMPKGVTMDDSSIPTQRVGRVAARPLSSIDLVSPTIDLKPTTGATLVKSSPDRYRRGHRRAETSAATLNGPQSGGSALPSGSGMATVGHLYNHPHQSFSSPSLVSQSSYRGVSSPSHSENFSGFASQIRPTSKDDMNLHRPSSAERAKRYRRRSIGSLDAGEFSSQATDVQPRQAPPQSRTYAAVLAGNKSEQQEIRNSPVLQRPSSSHDRHGSSESSSSVRSSSRPSSAKREAVGANSTVNSTALQATPVSKNEAKLVNIPPRGSSDATKRLTNPSPLSKPMNMSPESPSTKDSFASLVQSRSPRQESAPSVPAVTIPESPAAQHLAALNKKEAKKEGKSSRLRRAFSFGSAAELRKASAENNHENKVAAERAKLRKERYHNEQEAEQAAIAQKQEAAGLGEGIYSGQGQFFTGSTDNLSISSTASSASVMIRKMGKGMKKSTRSLVGLFRPKSVVGTPTTEPAAPEPSVAQVSMVTVEAEREKVNVNVNPHDQVGGGTGFPKLERNSIDAVSVSGTDRAFSLSDRSNENATPRRSIVGGEKERAEVLAAVKKGILKRNDSGNSSPIHRPVDAKLGDFTLPQLPRFNESPSSSVPSTPADDHPSSPNHRRTDSVTIEGEDYFMSVARFASGESKSMPGTPRSIAARNISFSPRIQFHDTWPSGEYDRRGEIATCNRLTPMLAQQIKEELNTFKMEMEVHEQSKVYTHFF
ncbi:bud neck involved protein [Loxospora ochrophaea]|nr:bud neck involved protein [Loxospora ochrophaea]